MPVTAVAVAAPWAVAWRAQAGQAARPECWELVPAAAAAAVAAAAAAAAAELLLQLGQTQLRQLERSWGRPAQRPCCCCLVG